MSISKSKIIEEFKVQKNTDNKNIPNKNIPKIMPQLRI